MERVLITGSAGHLGEALAWTLARQGKSVIGIDIKASQYTTHPGSVTDAELITEAMDGVDTVFHAATLHKPHVVTHSKQEFIDTNVSGTQALLNAAAAQGVAAFIFTSTTSVYGHAMQPEENGPAVLGHGTTGSSGQEHLRRDQVGGGKPVQIATRAAWTALRGVANLKVFSGRR
jgi:nucleoside-diphosphate-sugar epimerase